MDREDAAVRRWLHLGAGRLMRTLGLTGGWWCGLFLTRRDVFDGDSDGDVDILAGPLEFTLDDAQWNDRLDDEARHWPLFTPRASVKSFAIRRAVGDGLILWPPRVETVVACEAKANWYPPEAGTWKRTHEGEAAEIKGQLEYLIRQGVDRVGFLHLGATEPRDLPGMNPWLQAVGDAAAGADSFPGIYDPSEMPACGYFTAVLGAVSFAVEHHSGTGSGLRIRLAYAPNEVGSSSAWRTRLRERLGKLARPRTPTAFIATCPRCGEWRWQADPTSSTCPCTPAST